MVDLVGQTLGHYQIIERLGRGGMADVYQAFHPGLDVYRALKVIRPEFVTEAGFTERFQREARAVAALRHPNIVQMHDFGVQDNLYYMVMEFIEGKDLKTLLAERGQIRPFSEIVDIIGQVASALSYAHRRGIVHRDIKPANIMLNAEGQAILTDFGIAKMLSLEEHLTQTGVGIGTPAYMAPEQTKGEAVVGPPADIYSLGIVLYQMLTGQTPFSADTPLAVMMKVVNDPVPPPRNLSPDIPDVLQGVVLKATAKDPAQRYPTAEALVDGLKRSLEARPDTASPAPATQVTALPQPKPTRRMTPWLTIGAIFGLLLCVVLGVVGVWLFWPSPEPPLATWQFIIDASAGMSQTIAGQTKMDIAQAALARELAILPPNVDAGLRVFGGGASGQTGCDDTRLVVEPAAGQNERLANALAEITPGGEAPLTKAIVQAIGDFDSNQATNNILIIITAGLDTCEENAVEQLEKLGSRLGFEYELQLIGLGVAEESEQTQLRQMAEAAGGEYHNAQGQEEIGRVIAQEVARLNQAADQIGTPTEEIVQATEEKAAQTPTAPVATPSSTDTPSSAEAQSGLQFDAMVSGAIAVDELDTYTFEGQAGDQLLIRLEETSADLDPRVSLLRPNETELCATSTGSARLDYQCQLDVAGVYTLLAGGGQGKSGDYRLYLRRTNAPVNTIEIGFDEVVSGVIDGIELDAYTFEGSAGDQVLFRLEETLVDLDPTLAVYRPNGTRLCATSTGSPRLDYQCQLDVDGIYAILAGAGPGKSGQYNLYVQRTNAPLAATEIGFEEMVSGDIASIELDAYTFEASAGDQVLFRLEETLVDLDPALAVYRPNGTWLCGSSTGSTRLDYQCQLDGAGLYTILVGAGPGKSGQYNFYVVRANQPVEAVETGFDETVSGTIEGIELDAYTFEGSAGDHVLVRLEETLTKLDPQLSIYRPNGTWLCGSSTGAPRLDYQCQLDANGVYTVLVGAGPGKSGQYNFYVRRTNQPAEAVETGFDETVSGAIEGIELDAYTFEGSAGDQILLRLEETLTKLDPQLSVYRPNGTWLCGSSTGAARLDYQCQLDANGVYTVLVGAGPGKSGQYNFYVRRTNQPAEAVETGFDETISGTIEGIELDAYTFEGSAGDQVLLRLEETLTKLDPQFSVYRPNGSWLCGSSTGATRLDYQCQLDANGVYTVLVGAGPGKSGQYNFYVRRANTPVDATTIDFGKPVSGDIVGIELDAYTFEGSAGDQVLLKLEETLADLDPQLSVYRPNGSWLCGSSTGSTLLEYQCQLDIDGVHVILVGGGPGKSGGYRLSLEHLN